jgi:selenide,water dikinase
LEALGGGEAAEVLVGLAAPDDAAVYAWDGERAIVSTVDFFTPIVDDPYTFGAITAANAMSDIYAMGGQPLFALNIVAFPKELDKAILLDIIRGGRDKAREAGVSVIGGHSIDDQEPKYGMAVIGSVAADRIYRKSDGRAGDRLVLTKAVGTGIISTAIKRGEVPDTSLKAAVDSMVKLNARALELASDCDVGAITDITGFGLLGHLSELARLSDLAAVVEAAAVPLLDGALELVESGCVPGGTRANLEFVAESVRWSETIGESLRVLLCDAQTSGGLLISVAPSDAAGLLNALRAEGHAAADVGQLVSGVAGAIEVR